MGSDYIEKQSRTWKFYHLTRNVQAVVFFCVVKFFTFSETYTFIIKRIILPVMILASYEKCPSSGLFLCSEIFVI